MINGTAQEAKVEEARVPYRLIPGLVRGWDSTASSRVFNASNATTGM